MMMAGDDEEPGVAAGLVRLSFLVQGVFARTSERHGLTPVQAKLLCVLADRPRGMAELAGILGVEKAGLTGLVDRVERRGLAGRTAVPGDRRALRVTLTAAGRQAAAAFHHAVSAELDGLAATLPAAERARFGATLSRLTAAHGAPALFPAAGS